MVCIDLIDGLQHILRAGVHGLAAFDNIIHTKSAENLIHTLTDGNSDETTVLSWFLCFCRLFFFLLGCNLLCILNQLLLMLLTHIVDLDSAKRTMGQRLLNGKTGIVGMYVSLNDLIVRYHNNGVTD